jgi:hypothetical protein
MVIRRTQIQMAERQYSTETSTHIAPRLRLHVAFHGDRFAAEHGPNKRLTEIQKTHRMPPRRWLTNVAVADDLIRAVCAKTYSILNRDGARNKSDRNNNHHREAYYAQSSSNARSDFHSECRSKTAGPLSKPGCCDLFVVSA